MGDSPRTARCAASTSVLTDPRCSQQPQRVCQQWNQKCTRITNTHTCTQTLSAIYYWICDVYKVYVCKVFACIIMCLKPQTQMIDFAITGKYENYMMNFIRNDLLYDLPSYYNAPNLSLCDCLFPQKSAPCKESA